MVRFLCFVLGWHTDQVVQGGRAPVKPFGITRYHIDDCACLHASP